jgi:hypothetical protein
VTLDELQEQAAALDDLAAHPAWASVVQAAQTMYGERTTLERIQTLCSDGRTPELVGTGTLELVAQHRAAKQVVALPATLAAKYRAAAGKVVAAVADRERDVHPLGADVELTRG